MGSDKTTCPSEHVAVLVRVLPNTRNDAVLHKDLEIPAT
jgi:hypothetical protein